MSLARERSNEDEKVKVRKVLLTSADGRLHVGADDETQEAFDGAIAFFGQ